MNRSRENSYWLFMTDSDDPTGKLKEEQAAKKKREEALPERILRRVLEGMGSVVDRRLGRTVEPRSGLTTSKLIERMKKLIDERVRDEGRKGRIAPHHLVLKVEWGTHSEAPPETLNDLKNEVLAAAIDHINDHRYRTLAPVAVEAEVDIFTTGISVDPNFGEFEEDLRRQDEETRAAKLGVPIPGAAPVMPDIEVIARITLPSGTREVPLIFKPGGRRLKLFLSEFSLPTDHENVEFNFWVSRETQAKWIRRALKITRQFHRIYTFGYLGLLDDPPRPDGLEVNRGLIDRAGRNKPAYRAFKRG